MSLSGTSTTEHNGHVEKIPIKNGHKLSEVELGDAASGYQSSSEEPLSHDSSAADEHYRRWAIAVAWASVFVLLILASLSFALASYSASSAMFGFGFDALLDVGTSIVVVWRFYGSSSTVYSRHREHLANSLLAVLFLIAAFSVAVKAIIYLVNGTTLILNPWLYMVASAGALVCFILSVIKFYVGHKLNSTSVIADGYSSLACGVTALGIIISAFVFQSFPEIDYLDNVVALFVAVFLAFYGVKLLVMTLMEPEISSMMKHCCKKDAYVV